MVEMNFGVRGWVFMIDFFFELCVYDRFVK